MSILTQGSPNSSAIWDILNNFTSLVNLIDKIKMRIYKLLFLICLLSTNIVKADIVCLKSVLKKNGKIAQTVKTVLTGQNCPRGFKAIVDTASLSGPQGPAGAPGGFSSILPSGQTLTGTFGEYVLDDNGAYIASTYSFGAALSSAPAIHLILSGSNAPSQCPGSATAPSALPGNLCLYEAAGVGRINAEIFSPLTGSATGNKYGFGYVFQSNNGGFSISRGTWAVTAH